MSPFDSRSGKPSPQGSWIQFEKLLEEGSADAVPYLRTIHDPDRLGAFAATWLNDRRAASREKLLEYMNDPLVTFRHEPLVKRLFKLAQAANDVPVMIKFVVALDRALRRKKRIRNHYDWSTREVWKEESLIVPAGTTISKSSQVWAWQQKSVQIYDSERREQLRLFSVATRKYLRRRVWRYFRNMGKKSPDQYVDAACKILLEYKDSDCSSGLQLLDNWSLMHILFHHSDVLWAEPNNWKVRDGKSLGQLEPAPAYLEAWKKNPTALIHLVDQATCTTVRQWALRMLKTHCPSALTRLEMGTLIRWVCNEDEEISLYAVGQLKDSRDLFRMQKDDWLKLLRQANPMATSEICQLMEQKLSPSSLDLETILDLACHRSQPMAELGANWLTKRSIANKSDYQELFRLTEAACETVRPVLIRWLISTSSNSSLAEPLDLLELLDSRFGDVRDLGWSWFEQWHKAQADRQVWERLLENPYADVQGRMVEVLSSLQLQSAKQIHAVDNLNPQLLQSLWATVLLNIHRGGRHKMKLLPEIAKRLLERPDEVNQLLPLLRIALRSVRSTEWQTALAAIVQLVENRPDLEDTIAHEFPELKTRVGIFG